MYTGVTPVPATLIWSESTKVLKRGLDDTSIDIPEGFMPMYVRDGRDTNVSAVLLLMTQSCCVDVRTAASIQDKRVL